MYTMPYKKSDLEELIKESYHLIREHEKMLRDGKTLEEKNQARLILNKERIKVRQYLRTYYRIFEHILPKDIARIKTLLSFELPRKSLVQPAPRKVWERVPYLIGLIVLVILAIFGLLFALYLSNIALPFLFL